MGNIAQVTGVLRYNDETRDEMLKRVYWRDRIYTQFGGNFVRYANIEDRIVEPPLGGAALDISATAKRAEEGRVNIYANDDRYLAQKYITPQLTLFYGSSPGLNTKLLKYTFGQYYTGRISDIEEANVKFGHDYLNYMFSDGSGNKLETINDKTLWTMDAPKRHMYGMLLEAEKLRDTVWIARGKTGIEDLPNEYFSEDARYADFIQENASGITKERGLLANESEFTHATFKAAEIMNNRYKSGRGYQENFNEGDYSDAPSDSINEEFTDFYYNEPKYKPKSLLTKTNELFRRHKISSLAARFHTSAEISREPEVTDTAKTPLYGNSHGRNLLKKKHIDQKTNGYSNPYCRVWTYHHQYDKFSKAIRPFDSSEGAVHDMDPYIADFGPKVSNGREYLKSRTVLGPSGRVNIAPKGDACGNLTAEIKNCMFSIENLAWKDVPRNMGYLSKEQRGPNGGRIMWFPPYDLDFNESVSVQWNQSNFIGRGEPVFTYNNTNRQGTLSFALLIDHPSIIDNIPKYNLNPTEGNDDLEDDVLRFFAGCQIPNLKKDLPDCADVPKEIEREQNPGDEPKVEIPKQEKAKHIKFYVFFPNNYSGNSVKLSKADWANGGSSDRAWFDYLFFGINTKIADSGNGPGYEMSDNPVSNQTEPDSGIVHESHVTWKGGEGQVKGVYYKYRVDFDLHEKLYNRLPGQKLYTRGMDPEVSNYYDSKNGDTSGSFYLNSRMTNVPKDATHTFAQIVATMLQAAENKSNFAGTGVEKWGTRGIEPDEELIDVFMQHRFDRVLIKAGATRQDDVNSKTLAERRYRSVKDLLIDKGEVDGDIFEDLGIVYDSHMNDMTTTNSLEAKLQRYASVEMWYDSPETEKLSETSHATGENVVEDASNEVEVDGGEIDPSLKTAESPVAIASETAVINGRYETEAEYFKNIEREHPFVYKNLIQKFKYFSPAYHSISPEGFNARLTFLQQCTRQGHTISATDLNYAKTAGNLSFGRMPVCVLRIGDFINTKIIINSMSINYGANGTPQWDLNPEGAGVQPMYAKVQLGIVLIGGQSLDGPINRLQNAVSFNYYANTGVYDNRADRVSINVEKKSFTGIGETVREMTVETSGDKVHLNVYDESEYGIAKTTYDHIWSPYPNVTVKDDYDNRLGTYNEYKANGIEKGEDGKYKIKKGER